MSSVIKGNYGVEQNENSGKCLGSSFMGNLNFWYKDASQK